ncbi:MAG: NADH-quinone oxidoreductase subunit L, partial [Brevundimonas sp.]
TSYYSWRLVFMTFHNKPAWKDAHADDHAHDDHASHAQIETHSEPIADGHHDDHTHDDHAHHGPLKPHESPWVMLVPLILLSVGAVLAGVVFAPHFIGHHEGEFWRGAIFTGAHNHVLHESHDVPTWVKWSPLILTLIGAAFAVWIYILREGMGRRMAERGGLIYRFLYNKWWVDEVYDFIFVRGAKAVGDLFWKVGDVKIIDGLGPNGAAWASLKSAARLSKIQSGYVYHYAFVMLLGVAGLLTFAILAWGA